MKYIVLLLALFVAICPPSRGADSLAFKCTTSIFDVKEFGPTTNNGVVDLSKISAIPHSIAYISSFSFTKDGKANLAYSLQNNGGTVLQSKTFNYPGPGDNGSVAQLQQKMASFLIPLRFTGGLQYQEFVSHQPLTSVLATYTKLPTASTDQYLQFKKEDVSNTTIVITDQNEQNILYRIVVPNTTDDPHQFDKLIDNFKASLKASGKTDEEIATALPNFQKVIDKLKAQVQISRNMPQYAQFETYTYAP